MQVQSLGWEDPLHESMATPQVFLPVKSHRQRNLEDYSLEGHKESDMTEETARRHMVRRRFISYSLS